MTIKAVRDVGAGALEGEARLEQSLRPATFDEYVGQEKIVDNVKVYARAARARGEALDHVLLSGPPGLGKTSMAHILARELGVTLHVTSGPALVKKGDLAGLLTALQPRDILFIDEIHRLSPAVEEALYPAMEDFRLDVVLGAGIGAQTMEMKLERFTLIGATTRTGLLAAPLRDRFPIQERLDYYGTAELKEIATRAARKLALPVDLPAVEELAARARGTPRIAIRLLQRARDFAQVEGDGPAHQRGGRHHAPPARRGRARARRHGPAHPGHRHRHLRRGPGRHRRGGGLGGRGVRDHRGRLRALPGARGVPGPDAAGPDGAGGGLPAPRPDGRARSPGRGAGQPALAWPERPRAPSGTAVHDRDVMAGGSGCQGFRRGPDRRLHHRSGGPGGARTADWSLMSAT